MPIQPNNNYTWVNTDAYKQARSDFRQANSASSVDQGILNYFDSKIAQGTTQNGFDALGHFQINADLADSVMYSDLINAIAIDELRDNTTDGYVATTDSVGNPLLYKELVRFIDAEIKQHNTHLTYQQLNNIRTLGENTQISIPISVRNIDIAKLVPEKDLKKADLVK